MTELSPGRDLGRYTVDVKLGEGAMATVYRVRHNELGSTHALKVLQRSSPTIRKRLLQEGRLQAKLVHPNIVSVTDVIDVDDIPGLVMQYVGGEALDTYLQRGRPGLDEAERLFRGILSGVTHAHSVGVIHRDLKPANVMLRPTAEGLVPMVADFGLAKALREPVEGQVETRTGVTMGTPAYMAPEQVRSAKHVDERADVFSLGCILYELVCGVRPFAGEDLLALFNAIAAGEYRPPLDLVPDLPSNLGVAIEGCLRGNRDERIGSCEELRQVLEGDFALADPVTADATWEAPSPLTDDPELPPTPASDSVRTLLPEGTDEHVPTGATAGGGATRAMAAGGAIITLGSLAVAVISLVGLGALGLWIATSGDDLADASDLGDVPAPLAPPAEADVARHGSAGGAVADGAEPAGIEPSVEVEQGPAVQGCGSADLLEKAASTASLDSDQQRCLEERARDAAIALTERDRLGRMLLVHHLTGCKRGGDCGAFEDFQRYFLQEIGRSDASMLYSWANYLWQTDRSSESHLRDVILWSERALERKDQWEPVTFVERVDRMYEVRARANYRLWSQVEANGDPRAGKARDRARASIVDWLHNRQQLGSSQSEPRQLCASVMGSESACDKYGTEAAAKTVVTFVSLPLGADVLVDGELVGQAPLTHEIGRGAHKVQMHLDLGEQVIEGAMEIQVGPAQPVRYQWRAMQDVWATEF